MQGVPSNTLYLSRRSSYPFRVPRAKDRTAEMKKAGNTSGGHRLSLTMHEAVEALFDSESISLVY
jgi:hypothetical protein